MTISIIAAVAENNVIGKNNDLTWHISEDLKRFKKLTSGHPVIMGRKTYESLPFKPLPGRKNIVLTSQKKISFEGALVVNSIKEALSKCSDDDEVFICGGAAIYKLFCPFTERLYLTKIHHIFEGDTFFPEIKYSEWKTEFKSELFFDEKAQLKYSFINYIRKQKKEAL